MSIRPATAADYPTFARLFPELGTGDAVPPERTWEAEIAPNTLLLEQGDRVTGYLYFQRLDGVGYVRHVVVDPDHRGQGLGRALMREVARRLRDASIERWCLNVMPGNQPAVQLYERMGMTRQHASVSMRMGWDIRERLPAPSPGLVTAPCPPGDDPELERALGLPPGLLAEQHQRAGAHVLLCRRDGAPAGMAVFVPEFPGAYPFRADSAAAARSLMDAMEPHADPSYDYVQLVFEGQLEIAEIFERAGATRHLEFVHFAGEVPG